MNKISRSAAVLSASAAAALAAYGLGSQSNGTADAAKATSSAPTPATATKQPGAGGRGFDGRGHHGPGRDLASAAAELGVTEAKLRAALAELRAQGPKAERETEHAAAVAKALGITEAKLEAALTAVGRSALSRGGRRHGFGPRGGVALPAALARELGLPAAKVRTALRNARDAAHDARRAAAAAELADALGVDKAEVTKALDTLRPDADRRRGHDRDGDFAADLAKALGLSEAKVTAALTKLHDARKTERDKRRAAFTKGLADKLGVTVAKVEEVLGSRGRPFGRGGRGHHGRGPGGPRPGLFGGP